MKTLRILPLLVLVLMAVGAGAADNCTEVLSKQTFMVSSTEEWKTGFFTFDRFVGDKELCGISKIDGPDWGETFCGKKVNRHGTTSCNSSTCSRDITFIRDGIGCALYPFTWGPQIGSNTNVYYTVGAFYKPLTQATITAEVAGVGKVHMNGVESYSKTIVVGRDGPVTLTAVETPNTGNKFLRWEVRINLGITDTYVPVSTEKELSSNPTSNITYRAVFSPNAYTLKVLSQANGTTNPSSGTTITVEHGKAISPAPVATANSGFVFTGWVIISGRDNILNPTLGAATLNGTMVGDAEVIATFSSPTAFVSLSAGTGGTIKPSPGQYTLPINVPHPIEAIPDEGYEFDRWEWCPQNAITFENSAANTRFTITQANIHCGTDGIAYIKAEFVRKKLALTIQLGTGGTTTPQGLIEVDAHSNATQVVANANAEYRFKEWQIVTGQVSLNHTSATINPVLTTDATIRATFEKLYPVYFEIRGQGVLNALNPSWLAVNDEIAVNAVPLTGHEFKGWTLTQGSVQFSNPEQPAITVRLLDPGAAVIVAHFQPLAWSVSGRMTNAAGGSGISGMEVRFRNEIGQEWVATTGPDGSFNIGKLEAGNYTVITSHPCFGTHSEAVSITADYSYERSRSRAISMSAIKRKVQIGEITDLSLSNCPDAYDHVWTTDVGGAEQREHSGRDISVSFVNNGFKDVSAVVRFTDGQQVTVTNDDYIEVIPCVPGRPTLQVSAEPKAASGRVVDRCGDGLGQENVAFLADLVLGQCAGTGNTDYAWTQDGAAAGTTPAVTLAITDMPRPNKIRVTANRSGKTYTAGMDVELVECRPDSRGRPPLTRNELLLWNKIVDGGSTTLEPVPGDVIRDDDGQATVIADAIFEPECGACKHEIIFEKWVLTWLDDDGKKVSRTISPENADILLDQGFRDYVLVGHGTARDVQPGKERDLNPVQTRPRLILLRPRIPLPILGTCSNAPFYCQVFYSEVLDAGTLDAREPEVAMDSKGTGFTGGRDDGNSSFLTGDGDFILSARIKSLLSGEAGIMIRNSLLVSDRSLFLGRSGSDLLITHRENFANDAVPFNLVSTDECLRIARTGGVLSLHTAGSSTSCPDPTGTSGWTERQAGASLDLTAWQGRVYLGLVAGGGTGAVEFDNVFVSAGRGAGETLAEPGMLVNTIFADGNLVSNWSFESPADAFTKAGATDLHVEQGQAGAAFLGRHFARVTGKAAGEEVASRDALQPRITNGMQEAIGLEIRFHYRLNAAVSVHPSLVFHGDDGLSYTRPLDPLPTSTLNQWSEYKTTLFYTSVPNFHNHTTFRFHLVDPGNVLGSTENVDFDKVIVSPIFRNVPTRSKPVTTLTFADGLTQDFQNVKLGETEDIVSARLLDEEGRPFRTLPVFGGKSTLGEFHTVRKDPVEAAKAYFDDLSEDSRRRMGDFVIDYKPKWNDFREDAGRVDIEPSPLNRPLRTYGRSSGKDQDFSYAYGANEDKTFALKTTVMGNTENSRTVNEYQNAYGYVVKVESFGSDPLVTDPLVTIQEKDILGRAWASISPDGFRRSSMFNTLDQPISTFDPDAGSTRTLYDKRGLLRFFQDDEKTDRNEFVANVYDKLGRVTHVFLVKDGSSFSQELADQSNFPVGNPDSELKIRTVYDVIPGDLPGEIRREDMTNLKGKPSATYALTDQGTVASYFAYDERGQVRTEWKQVLHLPIHRTDFTYNLAGQMVRKEISGARPDGITTSKIDEFAYDEFNRLKHIRNGRAQAAAKDVARFEYWPDGKVRYLDFGSSLNQGLAYRYDESERLMRMQHEVRETRQDNPGIPLFYPSGVYEQRLRYDESGNIASQSYLLGGVAWAHRGAKYTYDPFNRLVDVDYGAGTSLDAIDYDSHFKFNSNFIYGLDGQITHAVQGKDGIASETDYGQYEYYPGTHRLRRIIGEISHGSKDRSHPDNYVYDANGNVILDRATKRMFKYDFRNLPIKVTQCEILNEDGCVEVKEILEMVYDAEGKRVAKFRRH